MTLTEATQVLGNLGEFVGAIAVVATLVYLSIQVRNAGRSATLAAVESNRSERRAWFLALRDSPYMPSIFLKLREGEPLDSDELMRLNWQHSADWGLVYSEWVQRELGLMGEFATSDEMSLRLLLGSPAAMDWWNEFGSRIYLARFVEHVNRAASAPLAEIRLPLFDRPSEDSEGGDVG